MAKVGVTESSLEDIGDAIREKLGTSDTYKPRQMAAAIRSIGPGQRVSKSVDALVDAVGIIPIVDFNDSHYIQTNVTSGTLVDIDSPQSSSNFSCIVFDCSPGDKILLNGEGGNAGRLWAFLDSENFLISNSDVNIRGEDLILEVPVRQAGQSAVAKCVVNMYTSSIGACYVGETVDARIAENVDSTLTIAGKAADAYEVGNMKVKLDNLVDIGLSVLGKAADAKVTGQRLDAADSNIASANSRISMINSQLSWITPFAQEIYPRARYVYPIFDTASGSMASFTDGGDGLPVKSVSVDVDPVQDLHGYDKPWTGGAGKNLAAPYSGPVTIKGITITPQSDGSVVLNGTKTTDNDAILITSGVQIRANTHYTVSIGSYPSVIRDYGLNGFGWSKLINYSQDYNSAGMQIGIDMGVTVSNVRLYPQVETGDVSTTFEPYSNICPITGHTSAAVTRTGKNLYSRDNAEYNVPVYATDGTSATYPNMNVWWIKVVPNTYYTISGLANPVKWYTRVIQCNENKGFISRHNLIDSDTITNGGKIRILTETKTKWLQIACNQYPTESISSNDYAMQIEEGSNATPFEPYQGHVYNITFPDAAGTVYGGTLDVTSGVLTVNRAMVTLDGSQSIVETQYKRFYVSIPSAFIVNASNQTTYKGVISDKFGSFTWTGLADASIGCAPRWEQGIAFKHPDMNTVDDWKTYFTNNPTVFSYELATPITYQLTPQEITTLLGINHVLSDTGDVSVEYAADPKLYINKVIANALNA